MAASDHLGPQFLQGPLYHGTTDERATSILAHGFHEPETSIWLTRRPELAHSYAEGRVTLDGGGKPAVLQIDRVNGMSSEQTGYSSARKNREAGASYDPTSVSAVQVYHASAIHGIRRSS